MKIYLILPLHIYNHCKLVKKENPDKLMGALGFSANYIFLKDIELVVSISESE
mgnify:CR=1 FL=1